MAINGDDMEYFKKLQCYKPKTGIIDAPISIEEIALLQNSVDKNIFGRVKFINRSLQEIIAIFIDIEARNIADEIIPVEKERFIYQDMQIDPGELYGNKIPIHLPEDTRIFKVRLEKVVFANGDIWNCSSELECECIPQQEIDIPEEIVDRIQNELMPHFEHMEYIHYYYEAGENFWECTCGKVNDINNEKCTFCGNKKQSQEEYLSQEKLVPLIVRKKQEKQVENEEIARETAEKERLREEEIQKEYERKRKIWAQHDKEREEERKEEEKKEKKRKKIKKIILFIVLIFVVALIILFIQQIRQNRIDAYKKGEDAYAAGEYELAIEQFTKASEYSDAKQKINEVLDLLTKQDKKEWENYLDTGAFFTQDELDGLINVLCYLGKSEEYVKDNAEFMHNAVEIHADEQDYVCKYNIEHDWNFGIAYVELDFDKFDTNHCLKNISFYGDSPDLYEEDIEELLNQKFDETSFQHYTWDMPESNKLLSGVSFWRGGYVSVDTGEDTSSYCEYSLSFY